MGDRDHRGRFTANNLANPGGRPVEFEHIKKLAREHSEEAILKLVSIMRDAAGAKDQAKAAEVVLSYGVGAPPKQINVDAKVGGQIVHRHGHKMISETEFVLSAGELHLLYLKISNYKAGKKLQLLLVG